MGLLSTIGAASGRAFGLTRVGAAIRDAYFNLTTLLLPGNGTNGAQNNTFLDSSSNNFTITRNGNTTQGTFSPFSQTGWSVYFNADTITTPSSSAFDPSGQNVTVDFFVYLTRYPQANNVVFEVGVSTVGDLQCLIANNGDVRFATGGNVGSSVSGFTLNTWHYITCVKSGNNLTVYLNLVAGPTVSLTANSRTTMYIGSQSAGNNIEGYISNFRYVRGSANVPTSIPTAPLTAITNTSLLTFQSNRFVDNSSNGFALNVLNDSSVQAFSPFAPTAAYSAATVGGSGYFDGSGDYLTASGNAAFAFGTGDFTVAAWIYPTNTQTITVLSSNYNFSSGGGNWSLYFGVGSAATLYFNSNGVNKQSSVTTTIPLNAWTHVAYTRVGTTARFFVNGVQIGADISDSVNYGGGTGNLFVGQQSDGTGLMLGYMSGIQVLKGTGYSTLPIPTAPATNIANTSLLLNFTNAGITDATAKHVFETVGNSQISTTQSKWGGGSLYFDGTGDGLFIPPPQKELLRFGTGDFTIEFWAWKSANGSMGYDTVISIGTDGNFSGGFSVELSNTRGFCFVYDAAVRISASLNPNDSTWHHYAVVRSGSTFNLYQDGTRVSTGTLTPTLGITGNGYIGAGAGSTGSNFNGYIDDLRVTRGYARYSGTSFTVPTAAYPTQ